MEKLYSVVVKTVWDRFPKLFFYVKTNEYHLRRKGTV